MFKTIKSSDTSPSSVYSAFYLKTERGFSKPTYKTTDCLTFHFSLTYTSTLNFTFRTQPQIYHSICPDMDKSRPKISCKLQGKKIYIYTDILVLDMLLITRKKFPILSNLFRQPLAQTVFVLFKEGKSLHSIFIYIA